MELAFLKTTDKGLHIWTGKKDVEVKLNGKKTEVQSAQGIRVYTTLEGKKDDVLEVDEKQLIPMEIEGAVKPGFFWL